MTQTAELTMTELLKRLNAGQIPMTAKVTVVYDEEAVPTPSREKFGDAKNPALALFQQWEAEDDQMTPEERAENERVYAQIEQSGIPRVRI